VHRVLCRQDQHGEAHAAIAQRAEHIDARQLGQPEVEHHHVVVASPAARAAQPFVAVADEVHMVAGLVESTAHIITHRFVVFNHQDFHPTGRNTLKLVPTPICDSTSTRPRCSSTMPYATDSPSPVPRPWGLVVKNGSKIFGRSSCRIPVPVSMNSAMISSLRNGFKRVRTVSTPRQFIASIAFSMSAMKHCTSRSASAGNAGSPFPSWRSTVSHLNRS